MKKSILLLFLTVLISIFYTYSQTFTPTWVANAGGVNITEMVSDNAGNVYVTGLMNDDISINDSTYTNNGNNTTYILQVKNDGSFGWMYMAKTEEFDFEQGAEGYGIVWDNDSNLIIIGEYKGKIIFDDDTLTSNGVFDTYIAKFDTAGTKIWSKSIGGSSNDFIKGVDVGIGNSIYIAGGYNDVITIGSTTLTDVSGSTNAFIAKLDDAGNVLWAKDFGNLDNYLEPEELSLSPDSNHIAIIGYYEDSIKIEADTLRGYFDVFVAVFDSNGNAKYAKTYGNDSDTDYAKSIAYANENDLYITGTFNDEVVFGGFTLDASPEQLFVIKTNAVNGEVLAAVQLDASYGTVSNDLKIDNNNHVYVAGMLDGTETIGTETYNDLYADAFILQLDSDLNFVRSAAYGYNLDYDQANALCLNNDILYAGGYFSNTVNFGGISVTAESNNFDIFVVKFEDIHTDMANNVNESNFVIYPNPASQYIVLENDNSLNSSDVEIINMQGQLVKKINVNTSNTVINISNLDNGTYFIAIKTNINTTYKKFVINR